MKMNFITLHFIKSQTINSNSIPGKFSSYSIIAMAMAMFFLHLTSNAQKIYWTDNGFDEIRRANLDGSNPEILLSTGNAFSNPSGIAVDAINGKIYWSDFTPRIGRANLDGTGEETILSTGSVSGPSAIYLDVANGKIYWTDNGFDEIRRANLDGSNLETLLSTGNAFSNPSGIAIDAINGKIYWSDFTPRIGRANLNGTGEETILSTGSVSGPQGVNLDVANGKIYWADNGFDEIRRANLDGSNLETLLSTGNAFSNPSDVAIDATNGKIYWTDATPRIGRANLDGTDEETLLSSGSVIFPIGIVLTCSAEVCGDGIDNNCDGRVDEGFDQDGDGWTTCGGDCNDNNFNINPGKTEICDNGLDDNCDGLTDVFSLLTLQDLMNAFNASVANGSIAAANGGGQLTAFYNNLQNGNLQWCLNRCDGQSPPPDFLVGSGVSALHGLIAQFIANQACSNGSLLLAPPDGSTVAASQTLVASPDNGQSGSRSSKAAGSPAGSFQFYPNPATNTLYLDLRNYLDQQLSISIQNHLGQQVLHLPEQELHEPVLSIDLTKRALTNGIYLLTVRTAKGMTGRQFVIAE